MPVATPRLAVLIDADNVPPEVIDTLFHMIGRIGDPVIREIYGSACAGSEKWMKAATRHALSVGRRVPQSKGRNATDIEMVIRAMDILASDHVQGYCIVSSDRDFTALAMRLRAGGKLVYGFGEQKAAECFRRACHEFHIVTAPARKKTPSPAASAPLPLTKAVELLVEAFVECQSGGWAALPAAAQHLKQKDKDFAARAYGSANLKKLIVRCGQFVVERLQNGQDAYRPASSKPALRLVTPAPASRS